MNSEYIPSSYEIVEELGRAYKKYRRSIGLSQKDIHDKTGVAMSTISSFENGRGQGLSLAHFTSMLNALGLKDGLQSIVPEVSAIDLQKLWEKENNKGRKA